LKERKAVPYGLQLVGEIDVLAADASRRRIWVIEAKHLHEPFSPPEIARHVVRFHGQTALAQNEDTMLPSQRGGSQRPYLTQLLANTAAVRANVTGTLQLLNSNNRPSGSNDTESEHDDWEVIPLAMTAHVEVAAFVKEPQVTWVSLQHLSDLLRAPRPPVGWWTPWATAQPSDVVIDKGTV
jgi:hypothetical protein